MGEICQVTYVTVTYVTKLVYPGVLESTQRKPFNTIWVYLVLYLKALYHIRDNALSFL